MGSDPEWSQNLEKLLEAVYLYHRGDRDKIDHWLRTPNPGIGGEAPIDLIRSDRLHLLVDLVRSMVSELD